MAEETGVHGENYILAGSHSLYRIHLTTEIIDDKTSVVIALTAYYHTIAVVTLLGIGI